MIYTGCDLRIAVFLLLSLFWTKTRRHHTTPPSSPLAIKRAPCGHDLRGQDGGAAWQRQQPPAKISRPKRPHQDLPPKTPAPRSPAQNSRADRPCQGSPPLESEARRGRGRGCCVVSRLAGAPARQPKGGGARSKKGGGTSQKKGVDRGRSVGLSSARVGLSSARVGSWSARVAFVVVSL